MTKPTLTIREANTVYRMDFPGATPSGLAETVLEVLMSARFVEQRLALQIDVGLYGTKVRYAENNGEAWLAIVAPRGVDQAAMARLMLEVWEVAEEGAAPEPAEFGHPMVSEADEAQAFIQLDAILDGDDVAILQRSTNTRSISAQPFLNDTEWQRLIDEINLASVAQKTLVELRGQIQGALDRVDDAATVDVGLSLKLQDMFRLVNTAIVKPR